MMLCGVLPPLCKLYIRQDHDDRRMRRTLPAAHLGHNARILRKTLRHQRSRLIDLRCIERHLSSHPAVSGACRIIKSGAFFTAHRPPSYKKGIILRVHFNT